MRRLAGAASLATLVCAGPLAADAQPAGRVYRLGILNATSPPMFRPETDPLDRALAAGLRERGYVVGENLRLELRSAAGNPDRLPAAAAELVALQPDVILADSTPKVQLLKKLTSTIPIVFCATADPVGDGLIASFARPGGNATGLSTIASELSAKRLELIREVVPRVNRVGVFRYPGYAQAVRGLASTEQAARTLAVEIRPRQAGQASWRRPSARWPWREPGRSSSCRTPSTTPR